ncbi:MAG TPA: serine protease [Epsilonproteobacteria bacterium]|nr:serine protease [Campylobacterota bacterium]
MKKILFVLILFFVETSCKEPEVQIISSDKIDIAILYPSTVYEGESVKLIGYMKNKYKNSKMGGLTLSFPQISSAISEYGDNTFDKITSYPPPQKIFNGKLKKNITSQYFMIEGWEHNWYKNQEKFFYVKLHIPKGMKELIVNARGVLVVDGYSSGGSEVKAPVSSLNEDQQGYPVKRFTIPIVSKQRPNVSSQPRKKDAHSSGTGFFINGNHLLTNYHVVSECKTIEILRTGFKSNAEVVALDAQNDLAVLKTEKLSSAQLGFESSGKIRLGEDIVVMGYPLGDLLGTGIKITTGSVSSTTGLVNDSTKIQITAPVQPGNSGGPVLNKMGHVSGVIYAKLSNQNELNAENVNLAIKSSIAKMFLDSHDIDYAVMPITEEKKNIDIADESAQAIVKVNCVQ